MRLSRPLFMAVFLIGGVPALLGAQDLELDKIGKALEHVVQKVRPSVVAVKILERVENRDDSHPERTTIPAYTKRTLLHSSGIILSKGGEVATLFTGGLPKIAESGDIIVEVTLNSGETYPARWKSTDPRTGITLLEVQGAPKLRSLRIAREKKLKPGSIVIAIGRSIQWGQVNSIDRGVHNHPFFFPRTIQTNLTAYPGDVGGLLVDTSGGMVGMLAFSYQVGQGNLLEPRNRRGINATRAAASRRERVGTICAVPTDLLLRICNQLRGKGKVLRGYIGAHFLFRTIADFYDVERKVKQGGAQVWEIDPEGPAYKAGLRPMDIVLQINERKIKTPVDLHWFCEQVEYGRIGETFTIHYLRISPQFNGLKQAKLTVAKSPAPAK